MAESLTVPPTCSTPPQASALLPERLSRSDLAGATRLALSSPPNHHPERAAHS
ncbi:MAG: hypothetical protein H6631_03655 [Anaerolineaceae bacterium]|nr:hypothetical protein [Anaerolineaceae bacterium]MCB9101989.1 hypothetical protein [Anaerolineales bacterium]